MGGDASKTHKRPTEDQEDEPFLSGWRGFFSSVGLSLPASVCRLAPSALRLSHRRMLQGKAPEIPEHVLRLAGVGPDKLRAEWSLPGFISLFLPEFPHRTVPGQEHFQREPVEVILKLRERPDRAAKARRGLTLSLQPLKGFDYDCLLSPSDTPDTQDNSTQTHTTLSGPALQLHPAQEKAASQEVFV